MARTKHRKANPEVISALLEDARKRIHEDYEKVPHQFKAMLLHIERELFDPDLSIGKARKVAKVRSNNYAAKFREIIGLAPREYVEHHRIVTAQRIIRHTEMFNCDVAAIVGFSNQSVFARSYERVVGHLPSKEGKYSEPEVQESHAPHQEDLEQEKQLGSVDPRVSTNTAEINAGFPRDDFERFWNEIKRLNRTEIMTFIKEHMDIIEIHHFHFLLEKAKYEGRVDRNRGEVLALAALDVIKLLEFRDCMELRDEKAIAYASLGNIRRLKFDFAGAAENFNMAESFLPRHSWEKPLLFAKVNHLRISLLWWQRDVEAAIRLFDEILPVIRLYGSQEFVARALLLGADIYDHSGHPDRALPLLTEALELTRFINDSYVIFSTHFNLTYLYAKSNRGREAAALIEDVLKLEGDVVGQVVHFHVAYLRALVFKANNDLKNAELLFLEAREGFLNHGLDIFAALVDLDLALLYLDLGEPAEASSLANGAIAVISRYSVHREAIAALAVLQDAASSQRINRSILRKALQHLDLVRKDPIVNFC